MHAANVWRRMTWCKVSPALTGDAPRSCIAVMELVACKGANQAFKGNQISSPPIPLTGSNFSS